MVDWIKADRVRALGAGSIAVWLLSLALPAYVEALDYIPGNPMAQSVRASTPGIMLLLSGWSFPILGAVQTPPAAIVPVDVLTLFPASKPGAVIASLAWFANPLWAWSVIRMLRCEYPHRFVAVVGALLAMTALQPLDIPLGDIHGNNSALVPASGIYLWAAAVAVPAIISLFAAAQRKPPA